MLKLDKNNTPKKNCSVDCRNPINPLLCSLNL